MSLFSVFGQNVMFTNPSAVGIEAILNADDQRRLRDYVMFLDFWAGKHWIGIPQAGDKPQITQNWCRRFVSKLSSTEFTNGVSYKFDEGVEETVLEFLDEVWENNDEEVLLSELAQCKSITGDAYALISWENKWVEKDGAKTRNPDFDDPFDIHENGKIKISFVPATTCFPHYKDGYGHEMESCTLIVPKKRGDDDSNRYKMFRYVYYPDAVEIYDGKEKIGVYANPYGVIPIVHFPNLVKTGSHFGLSDLGDLVPLNVELNIKLSDISEIIDYASSPLTAIYGAGAKQVAIGADKMICLPEKAKIENVEMKGDLGAARDHRDFIKDAMHEIGGVPTLATGAADIPANISSVALQILFGPLIDLINEKRKLTKKALKRVNQICLKMGIAEGLIEAPKDLATRKKFFDPEVIWGAILPKDIKMALEEIQQELKMGLTTRREAMKSLKKDNIEQLIKEVDEEAKEHPFIHGISGTILSQGQVLINPDTGEKMAEGNESPTTESSPKTTQPEQKPVGTNKEGKDIIIPTGFGNKNPGKVQN